MKIQEFQHFAKLIAPCFIHDGWSDADGFHVETREAVRGHCRQVLTYFDCPAEWQALVMLAVEGADYYGYYDEVFGG
jgi:hypothetical protein